MTPYIYIMSFSLMWSHQLGLIQKWKIIRKKKTMKPFDCELCLSFWLSLSYSIYVGLPVIDCIGMASVCGFAANLIFLFLRKFDLI